MRIYDIITKKKRGFILSQDEINYFVDGVMSGTIPDYQTSALLMAIYFKGLNDEETSFLTSAMLHSGDTHDLSYLGKLTGDKHSTGGVGDKTTLIVAPIVAACGGLLPKMSGRGLGHTGGTIDKLEAIPGFKTDIPFKEFLDIVKSNGFAIVSQTGELAPADKKIYALRDLTATVDSIPLIASSIMSKKLATGADTIMLDVKCGSGAFMKNREDAEHLSRLMIEIGSKAGRKVRAIVSDMERPLGYTVGNSLEVIEAIEILKGNIENDTSVLSIELAANIISMQGIGDTDTCRRLARNSLKDGTALEKFRNAIRLQGGNEKIIENYSLFFKPQDKLDIIACEDGFVDVLSCEEIGLCASMLGAGRTRKEDKIDFNAGICLYRNKGDKVKKGEKLATLYTSTKCDMQAIKNRFLKTFLLLSI